MIKVGAILIWLAVASSYPAICMVDPTDEEISEVTEYAREFATIIDRQFDLEDVKIQKCSVESQYLVHSPNRFLKVSFQGYYQDASQSNDATVRDLIACEVTRMFYGNEIVNLKHDCNLLFEQLLTVHGIDNPVEVDPKMRISEARGVLSFVSTQVGILLNDKLFTDKHYSGISQIVKRANSSFGDYDVHYSTAQGQEKLTVIGPDSGNMQFRIGKLPWNN